MCSFLEIPTPKLKKGSQWLDVFPTESVKLRCGIEGSSEWTYTWYRDGNEVQAAGVSFEADKTSLLINSATASRRGSYTCRGKLKSRSVTSNSSPEVQLKIYGESSF